MISCLSLRTVLHSFIKYWWLTGSLGIPAGALATGAGSLKTPAEREIFGGLANAAYQR